MNIRAKLTLTFFFMVIVVLTAISVSIFYFSSDYREVDFTRRLRNRAINIARVLIQVKEVNAEILKRMERNNPASLTNQYIIIYDLNNIELYRSEGDRPVGIDNQLLKRIKKQKEIKFSYQDYEVLGFLFKENNEQFTIIAAATDVFGMDALRNLRNVLVITFAISLVLVSFLGWLYAGNVLSPISKIVKEVSSITEANLNQRLSEGNQKDELSKLAQTFNRMLGRLQSAFSSQKNFIANASHEIKTPITVMSAEIEVTLLHDRDKEHYRQVLKSILNGLKNLNRLSSQLLLLAQTSADQPEMNFNLVRIDDILWEMKEELLKIHPEYIIDIQFDININDESLLISGDEQLLKVAILNLLDNGCKYSTDQRVVVNLNSDNPRHIAAEFINNGQGIDPENVNKVFEPFYRGKNNKMVKGFGIGLSLVNRILKLHNGSISVGSVPRKQTKFTVILPTRTSA